MVKTQEVKVVNVVRLCPKNSEYLHGYHLDNPKMGDSCNAIHFTLAGWALGKNNFSVVAIEIITNGKFREKVSLKKNIVKTLRFFMQIKNLFKIQLDFQLH